ASGPAWAGTAVDLGDQARRRLVAPAVARAGGADLGRRRLAADPAALEVAEALDQVALELEEPEHLGAGLLELLPVELADPVHRLRRGRRGGHRGEERLDLREAEAELLQLADPVDPGDLVGAVEAKAALGA